MDRDREKGMKLHCKISPLLFFLSLIFAREEVLPEYISLDLKDRHLSGFCMESVWGTRNRGVLKNNVFHVSFQPVFQGGDPIEMKIPETAEKLHLFGSEFDLPGKTEQGFFRTFLLKEILPPRYHFFAREESLRAFCMFLAAAEPEGRTVLRGKVVYRGESGKERWDSEFHFRCLVTPDGQIFDDTRGSADGDPAHPWKLSNTFQNLPEGPVLRVSKRLKYYKGLVRTNIQLPFLSLPPYRPQLLTEIQLNQSAMKQLLSHAGNEVSAKTFALRKSPEDLHRFIEKLKKLNPGMSPDETIRILGPPDSSPGDGVTKTPSSPPHTSRRKQILRYAFLRHRENRHREKWHRENLRTIKDLEITLTFLFDEKSGKHRLSSVQ